MDTAFSGGRGLGDSLDQSVADVIGPVTRNLIVLRDVHDGLVQLTLDHLVIGEPLLAHRQICLDVCVALASRALQLIVL